MEFRKLFSNFTSSVSDISTLILSSITNLIFILRYCTLTYSGQKIQNVWPTSGSLQVEMSTKLQGAWRTFSIQNRVDLTKYRYSNFNKFMCVDSARGHWDVPELLCLPVPCWSIIISKIYIFGRLWIYKRSQRIFLRSRRWRHSKWKSWDYRIKSPEI